MNSKFEILHKEVQLVINHVGEGNFIKGTIQIMRAHELLQELQDLVESDEELVKVGYYQALLKMLHEKIRTKYPTQ